MVSFLPWVKSVAMSRRSARTVAAAFPALAEGTQNGLRRLISDHSKTVAAMLDLAAEKEDDFPIDVLCEKCAQVMKQQQLSVSSFLARFFSTSILSEQAILYGKSGKGSEATLADRIAASWSQNKSPDVVKKPTPSTSNKTKDKEEKSIKRKTETETNVEESKPKKTKKVPK